MEGAWDDDDEDEQREVEVEVEVEEGEEDEPEMAEDKDEMAEKDINIENNDISKLPLGGGTIDGDLLSPPVSDQDQPETRYDVPAPKPTVTEDPSSSKKLKPQTKEVKLRGTTTMLDEEDLGAMPKEEIKESWIKIALGLRDDLSVKCVGLTLSIDTLAVVLTIHVSDQSHLPHFSLDWVGSRVTR